jgi:hypothetical protein
MPIVHSGGGTMSIWSVDLTTEDGARSATSLAGMACFIASGLSAIAGAFLLTRAAEPAAAATLISVGIEAVLFLIAGVRFRTGKGFYWGIAVTVVLAIEMAAKLATLSIGGLIINGILLIVIVNGVRGARALRQGFAEDQAEIFS